MISLKFKKDHKQGLIKKLQLRASALPNRTDIIKLATFSAISVAMVIKTATAWNTALDLFVFIPMLFLLDCFLLSISWCFSAALDWLPLFTCLFNVIALGWHLVQIPPGHGGCSVQPGLILQLVSSNTVNFPLLEVSQIRTQFFYNTEAH